MWSDAGFVADLLRARPSRTSIRESDAGREIEPACAGPCGHSLSARIPRHRHGLRFWCWSRRTGAAALRVAGDAVTRPAAGVDRPALHRRGALARAVVMAGAMERALDTAVTYAGERKQFGRPIGKFQAVQQNLAMNIVDRPGHLRRVQRKRCKHFLQDVWLCLELDSVQHRWHRYSAIGVRGWIHRLPQRCS